MRKVEHVSVSDPASRDNGKIFEITEWSAEVADRWATKMVLAANRGGGPIPTEQLLGRGMEAIFLIGVQTFLRGNVDRDELIPLLDELLTCVKIVRDPKAIDQMTGRPMATPLVSADDIEEVKTRWWLRSEVLRVHTNFSIKDMLSQLISAVMKPLPDTEPTQTSAAK